jgi:hypothetical protein
MFNEAYRNAVKFLSEIPFINSGGCLYSAYAIQQVCRNSGMRIPQLVSLNYNEEVKYYTQNKAFVEGDNAKATSSAHFGWTFREAIRDSDGMVELWKYGATLKIPLQDSERFFRSAIIHGDWNPCFDRQVQVPKIEKELGVILM